MVGTFEPTYSTNNIWWDENMNECLTPRIEGIESGITALETGKANTTHTHSDYALANHTHSDINTALNSKSDTNHSHSLADFGFQYGKVAVQCTANTVSTANVTFEREYSTMPIVTLTAGSSAPGTAIQEVTVSNVTYTGFTVCVYRTNTSTTTIQWMAAGTPK